MNWSVNLLHPYAGNVSSLGDCLKLASYSGPERRAALVIGYEHAPSKIDLMPLVKSFEAIAKDVLGIKISERIETERTGLRHPVHASARLFAWEVQSRPVSDQYP